MKSQLVLLGGLLLVLCSFSSRAASNAPEVEMSLAVRGKTNINQTTIEATNSLNEFVNVLTTNSDKFILSSTNITPTNAAAALPILAAYVRTNVFGALTNLTNSALVQLSKAGEFLKELKQEGRLPGAPKDTHGMLSCEIPSLAVLQEARYPVTGTFLLLLSGDTCTNHYTVRRASKDAAWQLEKAWRTDTHGRTILEWPNK
jgi:hypothetical protein